MQITDEQIEEFLINQLKGLFDMKWKLVRKNKSIESPFSELNLTYCDKWEFSCDQLDGIIDDIRVHLDYFCVNDSVSSCSLHGRLIFDFDVASIEQTILYNGELEEIYIESIHFNGEA